MSEVNREDEVVRYDNTFNKTSLNVLTGVQSNILMSVLKKMGDETKEDAYGNECYIARYEFKEIRSMIKSKNMDAKVIKRVFDELLNTKVEFYEKNGNYTKANLFSKYTLTNRSTAEITLSGEMTKKLMIEKNQYTILELDEYVNLKSKYSKELYRLLRQFKHTGLLIVSKSELIKILKPPKKQSEYDFIRKILNKSIEENREYFEKLKISNMPEKGTTLPDVCKFTFIKHEKYKKRVSIDYEAAGHTAEELELLEHIKNHGGGK